MPIHRCFSVVVQRAHDTLSRFALQPNIATAAIAITGCSLLLLGPMSTVASAQVGPVDIIGNDVRRDAGTGLYAEYFNNMTLAGAPVLARVDSQVNFDWGLGSPGASVPVDGFSARWTGEIEAPVTGRYILSTASDDGVRLWVNDKLVIDSWRGGGILREQGTVTLQAGRRNAIRLEYYEIRSTASAQLNWSYPGQGAQPIPREFLYPANTSVPAPPAPIPSGNIPSGVTAVGGWNENCRCCGGMAMAHIAVTWRPVPGASGYNLYRNGTLYQTGLKTTTFDDMGVHSGRTYSYWVTSLGKWGESGESTPALAEAPYREQGVGSEIPANLTVVGTRTTNTDLATDFVAWNAVAGATSYNLYLYDTLIASGIRDTSYLVPPARWRRHLTYTVTAIDAMGMESIPSNIATAQGAPRPGILTPAPPIVPRELVATPEWNAGAPRIALTWRSRSNNATYRVYRDGRLLASGIWGLTYFDQSVRPGASHTYTVTGVPWGTLAESGHSGPIRATALRSGSWLSSTPVQITNLTPNDDSVLVSFAPVPGAKDYRVYSVRNPGVMKYSGGGLSIEMNGISPDKGADLIVEAVDKLGPFQKMDGDMGPGAVHPHTGEMRMVINGLGDPTNAPTVIARSGVFHVACQPRMLTGKQVFFDTFRNSRPFTTVAVDRVAPEIYRSTSGDVRGMENDRWTVFNYAGDYLSSRVFVMSNHFMDTLYDGGTPGSPLPMHNNNASLVMFPKATADVSNGRVLHVTFEVDAHFNARRWCDVIVAAAGDPLLHPAKLGGGLFPTKSGNMFRWEIQADGHVAMVFTGNRGVLQRTILKRDARASRKKASRNGSMADLDKRHQFDLYLSQRHFMLVEDGEIVNEGDFPAGETLPFTKMQVYFVHQVYHTNNDRGELINSDPEETYWINHRPWADERHWDNMGFEVLNQFPAIL